MKYECDNASQGTNDSRSSSSSSSSPLARFEGRSPSFFSPSSSLSAIISADVTPFFLPRFLPPLGVAAASALAFAPFAGVFFAGVAAASFFLDSVAASDARFRFFAAGALPVLLSSASSSSSSIGAFFASSSSFLTSSARLASHSLGSSATLYPFRRSPFFLEGSLMYASISCFCSFCRPAVTCQALEGAGFGFRDRAGA